MKHVMGDTETWGTKPGAMIRSLGAVVFDPYSGELGSTFYANITDTSCEALGLKKDAGTEAFWAEPQNAKAQVMLAVDAQPIDRVLLAFSAWWRSEGAEFFWCHGATFDAPILEHVYNLLMLNPPWKFWNVRCCRTVLAMASRKPIRVARNVPHHALDDATAQARAVAAAFKTGQFNPA